MARRQLRRDLQAQQEEEQVEAAEVEEEDHRNSITTTASPTQAHQHRLQATQADTLPTPVRRTLTRRMAHQRAHRREAICRAGHRQACITQVQATVVPLGHLGRSGHRISTLGNRRST